MVSKQELNYKIQITSVFIISILLYLFIFIPNSILNEAIELTNEFSAILIKLGLFIFIIPIVSWFIFCSDPLQFGNSEEALFFQKQFPSKYIQKKLKCSEDEANTFWFSKVFNKWKKTDHEMYEHVKHSYEISYSCRLIYYSLRWLLLLFFLSFVTLITTIFISYFLNGKFILSSGDLFKIGCLIVIILFWIYLRSSNKLDIEKNAISGCWKRWQNINGISRTWLKRNVLKNAKNIDEAYQTIKNK